MISILDTSRVYRVGHTEATLPRSSPARLPERVQSTTILLITNITPMIITMMVIITIMIRVICCVYCIYIYIYIYIHTYIHTYMRIYTHAFKQFQRLRSFEIPRSAEISRSATIRLESRYEVLDFRRC